MRKIMKPDRPSGRPVKKKWTDEEMRDLAYRLFDSNRRLQRAEVEYHYQACNYAMERGLPIPTSIEDALRMPIEPPGVPLRPPLKSKEDVS